MRLFESAKSNQTLPKREVLLQTSGLMGWWQFQRCYSFLNCCRCTDGWDPVGLLWAINAHHIRNISTELCSWIIDLLIHRCAELCSVRQAERGRNVFCILQQYSPQYFFFPYRSLNSRIASEILEVILRKEWDYWAYQVCSPCLISSYIYIYSCYSYIYMYIYIYVYIWINSLWNYKLFPFLMLFTTTHYVVECDSLYPQI